MELVSRALALIQSRKKALADAEAKFLDMKSEFGHLVKIDTSPIAAANVQFEAATAKLEAFPAMLRQHQSRKADILRQVQEVSQQAGSRLEPELAAQLRAETDQVIQAVSATPIDPWQESGMRFLERCREILLHHPRIMTALRSIGLRRYTIERHWLGFHPSQEIQSPGLWGLPDELAAREDPRELLLVSGFVIPCFTGAELHRSRIRSSHGHYPPPDLMTVALEPAYRTAADFWVEGSRDTAMVHGAGPGKPFVRVAFELDSILLHQDAGDFCAVASLPKPETPLDESVAKNLESAPQFLVVLYPRSENPADRDIEVWRQKYPRAEPLLLPAGIDLSEARRNGLDLWQWVADALRPGVAPDPASKPKEIDLDEPGAVAALVPAIDVEGLFKKVKGFLAADIQADRDLVEAETQKGLGVIRQALAAKGMDLDEVMSAAAEAPPETGNPYLAAQGRYAENIKLLRKQLQQQGVLKPELEQELAGAEERAHGILADAARRYEDGLAKLESVKAGAPGGPPEWARKLLLRAGLDPDDPAPLKQLNREEVLARYGRGESLAGKNLSGADLSRLDLTGIDLRRANLQRANLSDSILDGANLDQAIANEADFTGASLKRAVMVRGLFQKARFSGAGMQSADLSGAIMTGADLASADLAGARLEKTLLEKANLSGAKLGNCQGACGYFLYSDASAADFSGAALAQSVFLEANVDQARFTGGDLRQAFFLGSKGRRLNFAGADLQNVRILNGSALTDCDFTHTRAGRASLMRSDLAGADFRGAGLERALVEECNLARADLSGVRARQARLTKSDLSEANLRRMDLFQGSLRKSKLVRTDLSGANLYNAEFYRTGVGDTRLDGANLKMTQLAGREDLLPNSGRGKKPNDPR